MGHKNQDLGSANLVSHRPDSLYEIFHENTKFRPSNEALEGLRISKVFRNPAMVRMMTKGYNEFPQCPRIPLPEAAPLECMLEEAVWRRRSVREFTEEPMAIQDLARLLFLTYGVTGAYEFLGDCVQEVRAAPSGGGLYPVELYVIANRIEGLDVGVYHYLPPAHALEHLPLPADLQTSIETLSYYKQILTGAPALFVFTAVFDRNTFKYGDRGYRFILLDAGHVAQNMLLVAAASNLGAVPIGGFRDDQLSALVGADGVNEASIYLVAVGHPTAEAAAIAQKQREFLKERGEQT